MRRNLAAMLAVALLVVGCIVPPTPGPRPDPGPEPVVQNEVAVARAGVIAFGAGLADTCDEAVRQLEAGQIVTGAELNAFMRARNDEARLAAFGPIHQAWQGRFGSDRWDIERAKESLRASAAGFRAVK